MKAVLKILHAVFLVICLGYLLYALAREGDAITELFLAANSLYLLPALLLWPCGVLLSALFTSQVIASTGDAIHYRRILAIYLNRIPAKYLPGGVWQTFARAYDLNGLGLQRTRIAVLVFYENFWTVVLAALFSSIMLLAGGRSGLYNEAALLMIAGVLLLVPIAWYFRKTPFVLNLAGYVKISLSGMLFWCVAGTCFILYLYAFDDVLVETSIVYLFPSYLFSYVVGFISIFTPQGIGVFEFVMTQLTEFSIAQTQALILLAGFRIIVLLGDMIAWTLFLLVNRTGWFKDTGNENGEMQNL